MKAIMFDQSLLQFVLLRKVNTLEEVKETCLEYAEHQKMIYLRKAVSANASCVLGTKTRKKAQKTNTQALDKMNMICKKFGDLAFLITKSKPKPIVQEIIRHKCKKPGHYAKQCQMKTDAVKSCNYCGRYYHTEAACYRNQAGEPKTRTQIHNAQKGQVMKKEVVTPV